MEASKVYVEKWPVTLRRAALRARNFLKHRSRLSLLERSKRLRYVLELPLTIPRSISFGALVVPVARGKS